MPRSVIVVVGALTVDSVISATNFAAALVRAIGGPHPTATVVIVLMSAAVTGVIFFTVFRSIGRGWRATAVLVTLMGVWAISLLPLGLDPLSVLDAIVGLVMIVAVWTPSARTYNRQARQARLERVGGTFRAPR